MPQSPRVPRWCASGLRFLDIEAVLDRTLGKNMKIAFIGGGNMATALIGGLAGKLTAGANIHVVDLNRDALEKLAQGFGVGTAQQIDAAVANRDVIVLAVKPQQIGRASCRERA